MISAGMDTATITVEWAVAEGTTKGARELDRVMTKADIPNLP